jgi:hypothetical protein
MGGAAVTATFCSACFLATLTMPQGRFDVITPVSVSTGLTSSQTTSSAILNPFNPHNPLPNNQCDQLYLVTPQTWAQLNPNKNTQKEHHRAKLMDAAKATKKISVERNRAAAALLSADIDKLVEIQRTEIEKITKSHN